MVMKLLAYDLETSPNLGYVWSLWNQNVLPTSGQLQKATQVISFAARWYGEPKSKTIFRSDFHDGHTSMVTDLYGLIHEADATLTWNGVQFDRRHRNREFLELGLTPPSPSREIDLMRVAKKQFYFQSNKLDYVSQELGIGKKIKHEGFPLWLACMAGDPQAWKRMERYNRQDVHLLIEAYDRMLPWIPASMHPNANLFQNEDDQEGCPRGCSADYLRKEGFAKTNLGMYQRYRCSNCGTYSQSGRSVARVDIRAVTA